VDRRTLKKTFVKEFVSAVQLMTDVPPVRLKFVIVKAVGGAAHTVEEKISAKTICSASGFGRMGICMGRSYKAGFNSPQLSKPPTAIPATGLLHKEPNIQHPVGGPEGRKGREFTEY
jgi:hypothetical protein